MMKDTLDTWRRLFPSATRSPDEIDADRRFKLDGKVILVRDGPARRRMVLLRTTHTP